MSLHKRFFDVFRGFDFDEILHGTPTRGSDYLPTPTHLIGVGADEALAWYQDQVQALSWLRGISYSWIILGFSSYGSGDRLANTHLEVLRQLSVANPEDPAGELDRLVAEDEIVFVKQDQICFTSCNGRECSFGKNGECKFIGCGPEGSVFWGKVPASGFPVSREQYQLIKQGKFVDLYCEPCASDEESVEYDQSVEHVEASVEYDDELAEHDEASVKRDEASVKHDEASVKRDEASVKHDEASVEQDCESVHGDHVVVTINDGNSPDEEHDADSVTFGTFGPPTRNVAEEMAHLWDQALREPSLQPKSQMLERCLAQLDALRGEIVAEHTACQERLEEERAAEQQRIEEERAAEQQRIEEERAAEQQRLEEERAAEQQEASGDQLQAQFVQVPMYFPQMYMPDDHSILRVYTMSSGAVMCTECTENCITITGHYYRTKALWQCAVSVGPSCVIFNDAYNKPPRCWICQNRHTQQRQSECKVVPKQEEKQFSAAELSALMSHMLSMASKE